MNLYLVSRIGEVAYGEFDSMVVCAANEQEASDTAPDEDGWCPYGPKAEVILSAPRLLGIAADDVPAGVVHTSFIAG